MYPTSSFLESDTLTMRSKTFAARAWFASDRWSRRFAACVVLAALSGCQDMYDQHRYEPFESSTFFDDGASSRPLVAGTVLVADTSPGTASGSPSGFAAWAGRLWFGVASGPGAGLWTSDGTTAGTTGVYGFTGAPRSLRDVGSRLCFVATTPEAGEEVWCSDGTTAGTSLFADVKPGTGGSSPRAWARAPNRPWDAGSNGISNHRSSARARAATRPGGRQSRPAGSTCTEPNSTISESASRTIQTGGLARAGVTKQRAATTPSNRDFHMEGNLGGLAAPRHHFWQVAQ